MRAYWQWTEEECLKVNTVNAYLPAYPEIAKINLTNFANASEWIFTFKPANGNGLCPPSFLSGFEYM